MNTLSTLKTTDIFNSYFMGNENICSANVGDRTKRAVSLFGARTRKAAVRAFCLALLMTATATTVTASTTAKTSTAAMASTEAMVSTAAKASTSTMASTEAMVSGVGSASPTLSWVKSVVRVAQAGRNIEATPARVGMDMEEGATLTITADYANGHYAVSGIPTGYAAYYTVGTADAATPDDPTQNSTAVPADGNIPVGDIADGMFIKVRAFDHGEDANGNPTNGTPTDVATVTVNRQSVPTATVAYSLSGGLRVSATVTATHANSDGTIYYYTNLNTTPQPYTAAITVNQSAIYYFYVGGSSATSKMPSLTVEAAVIFLGIGFVPDYGSNRLYITAPEGYTAYYTAGTPPADPTPSDTLVPAIGFIDIAALVDGTVVKAKAYNAQGSSTAVFDFTIRRYVTPESTQFVITHRTTGDGADGKTEVKVHREDGCHVYYSHEASNVVVGGTSRAATDEALALDNSSYTNGQTLYLRAFKSDDNDPKFPSMVASQGITRHEAPTVAVAYNNGTATVTLAKATGTADAATIWYYTESAGGQGTPTQYAAPFTVTTATTYHFYTSGDGSTLHSPEVVTTIDPANLEAVGITPAYAAQTLTNGGTLPLYYTLCDNSSAAAAATPDGTQQLAAGASLSVRGVDAGNVYKFVHLRYREERQQLGTDLLGDTTVNDGGANSSTFTIQRYSLNDGTLSDTTHTHSHGITSVVGHCESGCTIYYSHEANFNIGESTPHCAIGDALDLDNGNYYPDGEGAQPTLHICAFKSDSPDKFPSAEREYTITRQAPPVALTVSPTTTDGTTTVTVSTSTPNTGGTFYYYTGDDRATATAYTGELTCTTATTYHFYVGGSTAQGDATLHSAERYTTIDPALFTIPTVSVNQTTTRITTDSCYKGEFVLNNATNDLYYRYVPPTVETGDDESDENTPPQDLDSEEPQVLPALTVDDAKASDTIAISEGETRMSFSVADAVDGSYYLLAYINQREEGLRIGTTVLSTENIAYGIGATTRFDISRYHQPDLGANYASVANHAITARKDSNDNADTTVQLRWSNTSANPSYGHSHLVANDTVSGGNINYEQTYHFRAFGNAKYPSPESAITTSRYSAPAILDYEPYVADQNNASGTLVAEEGTRVYLNYSHGTPLGDPDPTDANSYDAHYDAGSSLPDGFTATSFKMIVSKAESPTKFPSEVVTVDANYSGYYVIHHYDNQTHYYLSLDSTSHGLRTLNHFDRSCLWFYNQDKALVQTLTEHGITTAYSLKWVYNGGGWLGSSCTVSMEADAATPSQWNIDNDHHLLKPAGYSLSMHYYPSNNTWKCGVSDSPVIYPVSQRLARAGTTMEITHFDVGNIKHVVGQDATEEPHWISLNNASAEANVTATLKVAPTGSVVTYHLPDHCHYYFTPATGGEQDFTFYPGPNNSINRSYSDHTLIPVQGDAGTPVNIGSVNAQGTITYTWVKRDGAYYYNAESHAWVPAYGDSQTAALEWDDTDATATAPDSRTTQVVFADRQASSGTGFGSTLAINGLPQRLPRTDSIYVMATYTITVTNDMGGSNTRTATAVSPVLLVNYGQEVAVSAMTARKEDGTTYTHENFQDGHIYLLANCGDRQGSYNERYYLTGEAGSSSAFMSNQSSYYRAFKIETSSTVDGIQYYRFKNVGLSDDQHSYYLATTYTNDRFDSRVASSQYIEIDPNTAQDLTQIEYQLIPLHESDGNTYIMIHPRGHATGISLCPERGVQSMLTIVGDANVVADAEMNGATLRLGNGLNSVQNYQDGTFTTTYNFHTGYFYGAHWQLIVPSFLPPDMEMDPLGVVTLSNPSNSIRGTLSDIKYVVNNSTADLTAAEIAAATIYDDTSKPRLTDGQTIHYWVTGASEENVGDYTYFHDSPILTHTAVKVSTPGMYTADMEGNSIRFDPVYTDAAHNDLQNEDYTIRYTTNGTDPNAAIASAHLYTPTYDTVNVSCTLQYRAYAKNRLASDLATYTHKARLPLAITGTTANNDGTTLVTLGMGAYDQTIRPEDYTIVYTTDGTEPTITGINNEAENGTVYTSGGVTLSGSTILRAKAFPTNTNYKASEEVRYYHSGQYMVFTYTTHRTERGQGATVNDFNMMLLHNDRGDNNTYRRAYNSHLIDSTFIFRGPRQTADGAIAIFNGTTGAFLDYDDNGYPYASTDATNRKTWKWGGEPDNSDDDGYDNLYPVGEGDNAYTLYHTDANSTKHFLVFDDEHSQWLVVTDTSSQHYHSDIAYRTDLVNYTAGVEFSTRGANLYIEEDGQWVPLNTADGANPWIAYSEGDTVRLRTSLQGTYIRYASNMDINIHHDSYDGSGREDDADNYVPWQQWHHFPKDPVKGEFTHYYYDVPGYSEEEMDDFVDTVTYSNPDYDANNPAVHPRRLPFGTFGLTLSSNDYYTLAREQDDTTIFTLTRIAPASPVYPDRNTTLTIDYQHRDAYANNGVWFNKSVDLKLIAEGSTALDTNDIGARKRFITRYPYSNGLPHYFAASTTETVAAADLGDDYAFLQGQPLLTLTPDYTHEAVWRVERQGGNLTFQNQAYPTYKLYARSDFEGGLYLVDPDPNTNEALYNYLHDANHPDNPLEGIFSRNLEVKISGFAGNSTYAATLHQGNPNLAISHDNLWKPLHHGDNDNTFENTRWTYERGWITPPLIAMNPSGTVTLSHALETDPHLDASQQQTVAEHLNFYYRRVSMAAVKESQHLTDMPLASNDPDGYSDYVRNNTTALHEAVISYMGRSMWGDNDGPNSDNDTLYSSDNPPELSLGQALVAISQLTQAVGGFEAHTSQTENVFIPAQTHKPEATDNTTFTATEGDQLVVGINQAVDALHWNSTGDDIYHYTSHTATSAAFETNLNSGNILTCIAYRDNEIESEPVYHAKSQDLQVAITNVQLNGSAGAYHSAQVEITVTSASTLPPVMGFANIYYNIDACITQSEGVVTGELVPSNSYTLTTQGNAAKISFSVSKTVDNVLIDLNNTLLHVRLYPSGGYTFYRESNEATQTLINSDYHDATLTGTGTQASPYEVGNIAELLTVVYNINNNVTPAGDGCQAARSAWYKQTADIEVGSISLNSMGSTNTPFAGHYNGGYHTLSGLTKPLFTVCSNAHVYNVVIDNSDIVGVYDSQTKGRTAAIAATADGATRIYNCGVRATEKGSVTGYGSTGAIVGKLLGTSRVINCYNFASVCSNNGYAGGIVGEFDQYSYTSTNRLNGIIFNCINYGRVHSETQNVSPVSGGWKYVTATNQDTTINCYNFFYFDSEYKSHYTTNGSGKKIAYNAALAAEPRFLKRFEFIRLMMNSNLKKCGWWETQNPSQSGNYSEITDDGDNIGKWVIDKSIAPYPIVQPKYQDVITQDNTPTNHNQAIFYPSVINPDYANATEDAPAYCGKKLDSLHVTIQSGDRYSHNDEFRVLSITDMDTTNYDYNYYKIQLPYYQDVFGIGSNIQTVVTDNVSQDWIVTGWKIVSVTKEGMEYTSYSMPGDTPYDFASRDNPQKDIYDNNSNPRVFAQGGYYNVPEGVTAITITAYWGKAVYLRDTRYEKTYNTDTTNIPTSIKTDVYGDPANDAAICTIHNQAVCTTYDDATTKLSQCSTVYDGAIVLVSNYFAFKQELKNNNYTITSVDYDNDHEPDYCFLYTFSSRKEIGKIRFDFINVPPIGMVARISTYPMMYPMPNIHLAKNCHFEVTETGLIRYGQFEYKGSKPLILNGGFIEQFVTHQDNTWTGGTYIQLGGHVWFKMFSPGVHGDGTGSTYHCPVTVTGGEYESFYLSGMFRPDAKVNSDNPKFYANGGKIGHYASGGQERIDGNVTVKADHIIADEFYGGGINAQNPITGTIDITINHSLIGIYAGGPKFGDNTQGVTTHATGTTFGTYYGAGIGGTSLNRHRTGQDQPGKPDITWRNSTPASATYSTLQAINGKTNDYEGYIRGNKVSYTAGDKSYGGVVVDYEMEEIFFSGGMGNHVCRFYQLEASLSKSNVTNATSVLTDCIINGDYFGGGHVGVVSGTAQSTLTDCIVYGNVYAGGNSSSVAPVTTYGRPNTSNIDQRPNYVSEVGVILPVHEQPDTMLCEWEHTDETNLNNWIDTATGKIYTNETLTGFGQVGSTVLVIDGNTRIYGKTTDDGKVFGGGNAAPVHGTASVTVKDNSYVKSDVFGGGNVAVVEGTTSVVIGEASTDNHVEHRPWVKGDVYGGGNEADVKGGTNVTIHEGIVGPVYGGGNEGSILHIRDANGTITTAGNTQVNLLGGYVGYRPENKGTTAPETTDGMHLVEIDGEYYDFAHPAGYDLPIGRKRMYYGVYGAGFGLGTVVAGTTHVTVGGTGQNSDVYVYGSVYGGGEAGQVGGGYRLYDATAGETLPADTYTFNADGYPVKVASGDTAEEGVAYYSFEAPTFAGTAPVSQVAISGGGNHRVNISGAAFGGGRGYTVNMIDNDEENFVGTEGDASTAFAGAVYGDTRLTIGSAEQSRDRVTIGSMEYYTTVEHARDYDLVSDDGLSSGAVYWDESCYVFDMDNQRYIPVTPDGEYQIVHVRSTAGTVMDMNISASAVVPNVQYYLETGRMSAAGGGERGPVYGSTAFNGNNEIVAHTSRSHDGTVDNQTTVGGNTEVRLYSGTLGDVAETDGTVDGCVYGGGLEAAVDGTSRVYLLASGSNDLWVRGDVYAGGCMGRVYNYRDSTYATRQVIEGGWVRNAHGGSNIVEHDAYGSSELVIGKPIDGDVAETVNQKVVVSESVYGGNGFSPSDGYTTVTVNSGMIGFVYAGQDINTTGEYSDAMSGAGIVRNDQEGGLSYEGNVYGGGFGVKARVKHTTVTVNGGVIRSGVFGGGEMAAVYQVRDDDATTPLYRHYTYTSAGMDDSTTYTTPYTLQQTDGTDMAVAQVTITGGKMSMVCGGGRGYSNFLQTSSTTPGAIMGDTRVEITGGSIDDDNYVDNLGAGNVYGGGLEGIVAGNTYVNITGGSISGHVFAGGRGYSGNMLDVEDLSKEKDDIFDRSSRRAGWVMKNTNLSVTGGSIGKGVYGGGEGLKYVTSYAGKSLRDTVANIHGNVFVNIGGGTIGGGHAYGHLVERGSYAGGRVASVHGYANMIVRGTADVAAVYGGNDVTGSVIGHGRPTTGDDALTSYEKDENEQNITISSDYTSTYVSIEGSDVQVGHVYGGGNGKYDYYRAPEYQFLHLLPPTQPSTYVNINTTGSSGIRQVFGGGNKAEVNTARVAYVGNAKVDTLFGGGNSATVTANATVWLDAADAQQRRQTLANAAGPTNDAEVVTNHIDYLFGGNNQAAMEILPNLVLTKGVYGKVYGGGNAGEMHGDETRYDYFGREVNRLSTYIYLNSADVTITEALFGGCNNADVSHSTYIDMRQGTVANLFGGNDVSQEVTCTRIDVIGGSAERLFGGSNGYYNYVQSGDYYNVYQRNADGSNGAEVVRNSKGRPRVDSTNVNIGGGTINSSVYGGGYAGDCRITHVIVNDTASHKNAAGNTIILPAVADATKGASINGSVFGGGYGDKSLLGTTTPHVGNVKGNNGNPGIARTDLYHVTHLEHAKAYGGGEAGDVYDAVINVHKDWNIALSALYGGCWGSDVLGTTTVNLYCKEGEGYNVTTLYGGNDVTGNVNRSEVNVYDGRYKNIYGAGNGKYDYGNLTEVDHVALPNSQYPVINFYNGTVDDNMYGGGNMGTCIVGDTTATHTNINDYAHVVLNVHGGHFKNNIFSGAAGEEGKSHLIYGLKQLNMDGGVVEASVYGGSESVEDGYSGYNGSGECVNTNTTTRRPSSILNLVGGTIKNNVYGAGYLGKVRGSVYINVGREAVNTSPVWTNSYNGVTYASYKPTLMTYLDDSVGGDTLKPRKLYLMQSIYNGANWGNAGSSFEFSTAGFIGGESRMLIDGLDYNPSTSVTGTDKPAMDIKYSLIGSGTSCEGGDIQRNITVRNYGVNNGCTVSKELFSIQRADSVILQNTAFNLIGDEDAYNAYPSTRYSFNRVAKSLTLLDYNTLFISAAAINIAHLEFMKTVTQQDGTITTTATTANELSGCVPSAGETTCTVDCADIPTVVNANHPYSLLMIKDGMYVDVKDIDGTFGSVEGYAMLIAEGGTRGVVTARHKVATGNDTANMGDGGFFAICSDLNTQNDATPNEYPYGNFESQYRSWTIGDVNGARSRHITIVAHSDVTKLAENKLFASPLTDPSNNTNTIPFAVTRMTLELPPASTGSYYKIEGGITVDDENGDLHLSQGAFIPSNYDSVPVGDTAELDRRLAGSWNCLVKTWGENGQPIEYYASTEIAQEIYNDPTYHFGLAITNGGTFAEGTQTTTTIASNNYFTGTNGYTTTGVSFGNNSVPKLDFYLTYSTDFHSTVNGDIKFVLREYDSQNHFVGDINVTVTISTVLEEFKDQEYELLAMYNEMDNHTFTRKLVLPASLQRRDLYLTSIYWEPYEKENDQDNQHVGNDTNFFLTSVPASHTDMTDNHLFALRMNPTEHISASLTSTLGWYNMITRNIDVFGTAKAKTDYLTADSSRSVYSQRHQDSGTWVTDSVLLYTIETTGEGDDATTRVVDRGMYIGVLDGRSSAAIDLTLFFNGDLVYTNNGIKGKVILGFDYYTRDSKVGHFDVQCNIRTRDHGDTIYMASANSLTRNGITIYPFGKAPAGSNPADPNSTAGWNSVANDKGKVPQQYLQTFSEVFLTGVYKEGDVIAILDTVNVRGTENYVIHGSKYNLIHVVRYSGDHYQFPSVGCAYYGPLINLSGSGKLTTDYMVFDGSMVCKRKELFESPQDNGGTHLQFTASNGTTYYAYDEKGWVIDTLVARGPIFNITDTGHLTLSEQTIVQHNFNNGTPGGAIHLHKTNPTDNPKLTLNNTVNIRHNISKNDGSVPTGAIHVDDGTMILGTAKDGTQITIDSNYLYSGSGGSDFYTDHHITVTSGETSQQVVDRYVTNVNAIKEWQKGNVYLTRKKPVANNGSKDGNGSTDNLTDAQSDVITISVNTPVAESTVIGISKWFPDNRDTIQVVRVEGSRQQYAEYAYSNNNFRNDSANTSSYPTTQVFYHPTISPLTLYFQRCATFQKQDDASSLVYHVYDDGGTLQTYNHGTQLAALQYDANVHSSCPDETDSVRYNVHGGFYPYTFQWSWGTDANALTEYRTYTSKTSNAAVNADLLAGSFAKATASNTNVSNLYGMNLANAAYFGNNDSIFHYQVTATDLAGCSLTKKFDVKMTFAPTATDIISYGTGDAAWTDTNSGHTATATRKYKGLHLISQVAPDAGWGNIAGSAYTTGGATGTALVFGTTGTRLCPGDIVTLNATGNDNHDFIQWDFDPYDEANTALVMPNRSGDMTVTAYFGPKGYWKNHISSNPGTDACSFDYNGDLHIYNESGLAWLISLCNGFNGQQINTFYFNTVHIHNATNGGKDEYNMKDYLWTPLGTRQHPFMGTLEVDDGVKIQGIIVNEPDMDNVGFFGFLDRATVNNLNVSYSLFHGLQYVGAIAAEADSSIIENATVAEDDGNLVTIITSQHTSGGMIGKATRTTINGTSAKAKYMGTTIYNGGVVGYADGVNISNSTAYSSPRGNATLYTGGLIGYSTAAAAPIQEGKSRSGSHLVNNYVHFDQSGGKTNRAGGLVGYARNTRLANNYVYGTHESTSRSGAIGANIGTGVLVDNCFYEQGFDHNAFGYYSRLDTTSVSSFSGSGTHVILTDTLGRNSNLTRQLNRWVYAHGDSTLHFWHSDTADVNNGYPVFGDPEYQPIDDVRTMATCDSLRLRTLAAQDNSSDTVVFQSGTYYYHVVDSAEFTDTLVTLHLTVNYSELTELADTIGNDREYDNHGFHLTYAELELLRNTLREQGNAVTVVLHDTLQTMNGCDSLVTLYLTFSTTDIAAPTAMPDLKVYPNPTTRTVTVEATGLQRVELYDGVSRKLSHHTPDSGMQHVVLNLEGYPTGAYYLRIHTSEGTVIQKVIKR